MKTLRNILLVVVFCVGIVMISGCTADLSKPEISFEPPRYVEQMPAREDKQDFVSTGSIFGQGDNPLL